jgi:hypothetical protein
MLPGGIDWLHQAGRRITPPRKGQMFSHPQHIIDIHERQVLEWTREQSHGWGSHGATSPGQRPSNGSTLFGRIKALLRNPGARPITSQSPALSAQE